MLTLDFPETSYAEWIQQLEKDLKGKPWSDLQWQLGEGILVDPFYHSDNFSPQRPPLVDQRNTNTWEIGEYIDGSNPTLANRVILDALEGGAEAIEISLTQPLDSKDLAILLQGVQLEFIAIHFVEAYAQKQALEVLQLLKHFVLEQGFDPAKISGSVALDLTQHESTVKLIRWVNQELPQFKVCCINGRDFQQGAASTASELAAIIQAGANLLDQLQEHGAKLDEIANQFQFSVAIGTSYFVEIAKLRALRILWHNVLNAFGVERSTVEISVHFSLLTPDHNPNTNLIRATTQAMSAVIGGANRLHVLPSDTAQSETSTPFAVRIARNVQHLLRLESYLDKVIDPAAGSYYIEKLTEELAQKAWAIFQESF
jgi:methylmalonyl-CoA mutase